MMTLAEIKTAVDELLPEQKQELLQYLSSRLLSECRLLLPRQFSAEQLSALISQDEEDLLNLNVASKGKPLLANDVRE